MAQRIEWFDVTVLAGTLKSAPAETAVRFNTGEVERIELTIPDGHVGLTGIRFNSAHQQIIPLTRFSYITGNNREAAWDLHGYPNNGNWSVTCYNTDVYDHTFHFAFLVNELGPASAMPVGLIPAPALGSGVPPVTVAGLSGAAGFITPEGV